MKTVVKAYLGGWYLVSEYRSGTVGPWRRYTLYCVLILVFSVSQFKEHKWKS